MVLAKGTILRKRYQIIQLLGRGGFGETYLAEDIEVQLATKPKRVVKRLLPDMMQPVILDLFKKEAATLDRLGEHNSQIARFFDYFQENQEFYLVQGFIEGRNLSHEITQGKKLSESDVIKLLTDFLPILAYLHQNQIIHRDIKPENIMRRNSDGKLVLIDFGIVKEMGSVVVSQGQTRYTVSAGTPGYMPAEQAAGKPKYSSDVYAVGVMAIFALTGISPENLQEDNYGEIIWRKYASVSNGLANILTKMVRDHFSQRYKDATEALAAIQSLTSAPSPPPPYTKPSPTKPSLPPPPTKPSPSPPNLNRRTFLQMGALAGGGFIVAVASQDFWGGNKSFQFTSVQVDSTGRITSRIDKQAKYYCQNLGNSIFIDMVAIPGDTFTMGTPNSEPNRESNEGPQRQVTVPSFYLAKYPITQAQYQAIMGQNPSNFKGSDLPVEMVSWNNAVEFCQKLAQKTGQAYRLPSEAEWEYACRAGTTTPFCFGETITTNLANYDGRKAYGNGPTGQYRGKTTPVGSFPPNAFGLYDMHGNVWEWCQDVWHENYNNAPTDGSAWETGGESNRRVLRGGSWNHYPWGCRSGLRGRGVWVNWFNPFGFRVAVSRLPVSGS